MTDIVVQCKNKCSVLKMGKKACVLALQGCRHPRQCAMHICLIACKMLESIRIISSDATVSLSAIAEAVWFFNGKAVAYADLKMGSLVSGVRQGYAAPSSASCLLSA